MFYNSVAHFCLRCFSRLCWIIRYLIAPIGFITISISASAQKPETAQPLTLDSINITATRSNRSPAQIPNSITQITHYPQHNYQPFATLDKFARGTPGFFSESV